MGKNRQLASVVSAKIWKTVVFSGAMLSAPLASADPAPQQAPVARKEPVKEVRTADQINADLADRDLKINVQIDLVVAAASDADRAVAKSELDKLDKERKALRAELKALKLKPAPGTTSAAVIRAQLALNTNELKIMRYASAVATAKLDKEREAAKLKLAAARKDREAMQAKLAIAKEDAAKPRPRTPPAEVRPTGRGFILS